MEFSFFRGGLKVVGNSIIFFRVVWWFFTNVLSFSGWFGGSVQLCYLFQGGLVVLYSSLDLFFLLNNIASSYWLFEFIIVAGLIRQRYKYPDLERPLKVRH